ncbi:DUF4178 domain-containing protein [Sphingomonas glacialis]|uniref:DUF4178 domain-containing protein n=1 Tax=Sphingomonas glacialis TaxID=658225 RepID=A0A502FCY4_9SPHN|nr:DUF4178 domain-containing protein [Sphingomonas glacialis]TPG47196.1 DUF4178 domain-containing protein [Sphingomonas glacialis]
MINADCPNCGAAVRFRSADLPVRVCDYCRSSLVRSGEVLQAMGKIAEVPADVSPLQIGTRGMWTETPFELIGRVRWRWADGGWNEWLMLFADGSTGWLGEAMGRYMALRALDHAAGRTGVVRALRDDSPIALGMDATIDRVRYIVTDIKQATCVASEGELPFSAPAGLAMKSLDLQASDGRCASVQKDRGQVSVYVGAFVDLAGLRATNMRAFEDWPMPNFAA